MRLVQASEAINHLPSLLDEVERGETVIITRQGRAIARIVPETKRNQHAIDIAVNNLMSRRSGTNSITVEELLSARDEGRK